VAYVARVLFEVHDKIMNKLFVTVFTAAPLLVLILSRVNSRSHNHTQFSHSF